MMGQTDDASSSRARAHLDGGQAGRCGSRTGSGSRVRKGRGKPSRRPPAMRRCPRRITCGPMIRRDLEAAPQRREREGSK